MSPPPLLALRLPTAPFACSPSPRVISPCPRPSWHQLHCSFLQNVDEKEVLKLDFSYQSTTLGSTTPQSFSLVTRQTGQRDTHPPTATHISPATMTCLSGVSLDVSAREVAMSMPV